MRFFHSRPSWRGLFFSLIFSLGSRVLEVGGWRLEVHNFKRKDRSKGAVRGKGESSKVDARAHTDLVNFLGAIASVERFDINFSRFITTVPTSKITLLRFVPPDLVARLGTLEGTPPNNFRPSFVRFRVNDVHLCFIDRLSFFIKKGYSDQSSVFQHSNFLLHFPSPFEKISLFSP